MSMDNSRDGDADAILPNVKKTILVLSGKGGVGKSTVAAQLAMAFQQSGKKVGLLDIDLCGPSIPKMMGAEGSEIHQCQSGWVPVYTDSSQTLGLMSIGFLLGSGQEGKDEAVVWRGPKKNAMIKQFLTDVDWGELDVLLVDTPPGTSDEHITVMETLRQSKAKVEGAVVVTTPQAMSIDDVRRELTFCRRAGIAVLGIIENMSGYRCPHCSECTDVFSSGGGKTLAEHAKVPFLGAVPIDPAMAEAADKGCIGEVFRQSPAKDILGEIAENVWK